jgi:hypothetical protein
MPVGCEADARGWVGLGMVGKGQVGWSTQLRLNYAIGCCRRLSCVWSCGRFAAFQEASQIDLAPDPIHEQKVSSQHLPPPLWVSDADVDKMVTT